MAVICKPCHLGCVLRHVVHTAAFIHHNYLCIWSSSACFLMCLRSRYWFTGSCCKMTVLQEQLCEFSSAVCFGLEAAKLLPQHSLGSHLKASFSGLFCHRNCSFCCISSFLLPSLLFLFQLKYCPACLHHCCEPFATVSVKQCASMWCPYFCHPWGSNWSMLICYAAQYSV